MLNETLVKFQLEHIYNAIENRREYCQSVKKWCVTVWLAIVAGILTNKLSFPDSNVILVIILPIMTFWIYEGIAATHILLLEKRAIEFENMLISDGYSIETPLHFFYISGHYNVTLSEKLSAFSYAIFKMETIIMFYSFLLMLSVIIMAVKEII